MEKLHPEVKKWIGEQRGYVRFWLNWHLSQKNGVSKRISDDIYRNQKFSINIVRMDSKYKLAEKAREKFPFISTITVFSGRIDISAWPKKMEQMTELLRWFAENGIRQTEDSEEDEDNHSWTWHLDEIDLQAYFKSDEPESCQYIQDGVKEVPKYKMVCPGDPDYPADE